MLSLLLFHLQGCAPHLYSDGTDTAVAWEAPENSWEVGEVPEGMQEEGYGKGEIIPDFRLPDQFGEEVSLWQFYGQLVLVDVSTLWCSPCQDLAEEAEETSEQYAGQGFKYVTLLAEDLDNEVPDRSELNLWVDAYGLTSPVLADSTEWAKPVVPAGVYPHLMLMGRDMRVLDPEVFPPTDARIREVIDQAI